MPKTSFYKRGEHVVINYWTADYWLQLDLRLGPNSDNLKVFSNPPIGPDIEGQLDPLRLKAAVVQAIHEESESLGIDYEVAEMAFTQADFDCYELYATCARLLLRHVHERGEFCELTILGPPDDLEQDGLWLRRKNR